MVCYFSDSGQKHFPEKFTHLLLSGIPIWAELKKMRYMYAQSRQLFAFGSHSENYYSRTCFEWSLVWAATRILWPVFIVLAHISSIFTATTVEYGQWPLFIYIKRALTL